MDASAILAATAAAAEADPAASLDLVTAGLAMAELQRGAALDPKPPVELIAAMAAEVRAALDAGMPGDTPAEAAAEALAAVIAGGHGFVGDAATYDDLANADLAAVLQRRRGLPVVLSLIYIAVARGAGLVALGLNLPGHVAVAIQAEGSTAALDPFRAGIPLTEEDAHALQVAVLGEGAPPPGSAVPAMSDIELLLRIQNNRKARLMEAEDMAAAEASLRIMLQLAPRQPVLWRELALLAIQDGRLMEAGSHLRHMLTLPLPPEDATALQEEAASLLDQLHRRLN